MNELFILANIQNTHIDIDNSTYYLKFKKSDLK